MIKIKCDYLNGAVAVPTAIIHATFNNDNSTCAIRINRRFIVVVANNQQVSNRVRPFREHKSFGNNKFFTLQMLTV
jgi:hypothetical protein